MRILRHYWFSFGKSPHPSPLNLGCGVTAYDYDDATALLQERVFDGKQVPAIVSCSEDVDVSLLEKNHVLPNIGLVTVRGVWFPQGYERRRP